MEDVPLVEFMCLVCTHMLGESYHRRLRSLLLYLCSMVQALINSIVRSFWRNKINWGWSIHFLKFISMETHLRYRVQLQAEIIQLSNCKCAPVAYNNACLLRLQSTVVTEWWGLGFLAPQLQCCCFWLLLILCSAVLRIRSDSVPSCGVQFWASDCYFFQHIFWYPLKWCTDSTVKLLHS